MNNKLTLGANKLKQDSQAIDQFSIIDVEMKNINYRSVFKTKTFVWCKMSLDRFIVLPTIKKIRRNQDKFR